MIRQINALEKAIAREIRPPYMTLTKISLPSLSVPNGCSREGRELRISMFCVSKPYLDNIGTTIDMTTMTIRKARPIIASLFFLYLPQASCRKVFDSIAMNSEFFSFSGSSSNISFFSSVFSDMFPPPYLSTLIRGSIMAATRSETRVITMTRAPSRIVRPMHNV